MYTIEQQVLVAQPTAVIRDKVAVADMPQWFGRTFELTAGAIQRCGVEMAGPPFARYRMMEDAVFEVEAGFPVSAPIAADGEVEPSTLPGGPVIATWHVGPYDGLTGAYAALEEWLREHDNVSAGPPWEVYLSEPAGDPGTWVTEVVQPYSHSRATSP